MIKLLFKLVSTTVAALVFGLPVFLIINAVSDQPLVQNETSMGKADVERIHALLKQHDPRTMRDGQVRRLTVSERDLNLMMDQSLRNASLHGVDTSLKEGKASLDYSLTLPENPLGKFVNLSLQLQSKDGAISVDSIKLGDNISVAGWLLNPAVVAADTFVQKRSLEYRAMRSALQDIRFGDQQVSLVYRWKKELAKKLQSTGRSLLIPENQQQAIQAYYHAIANTSALHGHSVSVAQLLPPLFSLATARSANNGSAQMENRALILALALSINGRSQALVMPSSRNNTKSTRFSLKPVLRGRSDLAQHFILSAAITAAAGTGLADAAGIFKEIDDSNGGSGFSFVDLLADRAGVSFAEMALGERAESVQQRLAQTLTESVFMPDIQQLPEGITALEFSHRYTDLDSISYALVNDEIERRISSCSLYQ